MKRRLLSLFYLMLCMGQQAMGTSIAVGLHNPGVFCYINTPLQMLMHNARWMNTMEKLRCVTPKQRDIAEPLFELLDQAKEPDYNALIHSWWPSVINPTPFATALINRYFNGNINQMQQMSTTIGNVRQHLCDIFGIDAYQAIPYAVPLQSFSINQLIRKQPPTGLVGPCVFFSLLRHLSGKITKAPLSIEPIITINDIKYVLTGISLHNGSATDGHVTALVKDIQFDTATNTWANSATTWHFINDESVASAARSKHILNDLLAHGMHRTHGYPNALLYQAQ